MITIKIKHIYFYYNILILYYKNIIYIIIIKFKNLKFDLGGIKVP